VCASAGACGSRGMAASPLSTVTTSSLSSSTKNSAASSGRSTCRMASSQVSSNEPLRGSAFDGTATVETDNSGTVRATTVSVAAPVAASPTAPATDAVVDVASFPASPAVAGGERNSVVGDGESEETSPSPPARLRTWPCTAVAVVTAAAADRAADRHSCHRQR